MNQLLERLTQAPEITTQGRLVCEEFELVDPSDSTSNQRWYFWYEAQGRKTPDQRSLTENVVRRIMDKSIPMEASDFRELEIALDVKEQSNGKQEGNLRIEGETASGLDITLLFGTNPNRPHFGFLSISNPDGSRITCHLDREGEKLAVVLPATFQGNTEAVQLTEEWTAYALETAVTLMVHGQEYAVPRE